VDRLRVWLVVSPLITAGVLVSHALAYRLTGTPPGSAHQYLDHTPQVLLALAVVAFGLGGLSGPLQLSSAWPFPLAALATFVVQEHVEGLAHTGELPWLLDSRAFVVGVLLQVPLALLAWGLARHLLDALAEPGASRPRLPRFLSVVVAAPVSDVRPAEAVPRPGRGPPLLRTLSS
jgi:hypothetical protein